MRARRRPAGSARRGCGLGLGLGWRASGPIKIFFLDQVKLNVLPFISGKNSIQFYLKRQVICLGNKKRHAFYPLESFKRDKRESLEEEVSKLNFPRSPRNSRPRAAAVARSGSSPAL